MNQKTSKVEKEFYLRCSYLTLSVLFDKEPLFLAYRFAHKKANEPYESQARLLFKLLQLKIRSQLSE